MNIKQALYIKTIADEGSISGAAKKLYISQPSLSQMLSLIENELGMQLFDRSHKDLKPTPAGECFLSFAREMINSDIMFNNAIQEFRDQKRGRLRLGISRQRCASLLPSVMNFFLEKYPLVKLDLMEGGSSNLIKALLDREIDLAFATIEDNNPEIDYQLIKWERIGVLTGKGSPLANTKPSGTTISFRELSDCKFVLLKPGHNLRSTQDEILKKIPSNPDIILETDSMEIARSVAVRCGIYTICSDFIINQGEYFYPLRDLDLQKHFYACTRKEQHKPQYLLDFIEAVKNILKPRATLI